MKTYLLELSRGNIFRIVLLAIFPWLPAYLYERVDFLIGIGTLPGGGHWYYTFSGTRLVADVVSFALGGILVAYLLRPRWAIVQVFLSSVLIWTLFYGACSTFRLDGLLHSECYQTGPDGLAGFRLAAMLFSFGALPAIARAASKGGNLDVKARLAFALASGVVLTVVTSWFPLTAWFSGVTYIPPLDLFQGLILVGVPQLATGILAARIGRSLKAAASAGVVSLLAISAGLWTLQCPSCDRSVLYPLVPSWAIFALIGGLVELGPPRQFLFLFRGKLLERISREDLGRVAVALVLTVCLSTLAIYNTWDARVLYQSNISPTPAQPVLGQSIYPYVAGYYNSTQYRICCLEVGVSFAKADLRLLFPDNFLMAGMGVQSPNCCVDGWDLGWRADVFLMPDGNLVVSGSTWGTCDGNANCGGNFWQQLRYHAQATLSAQNVSTLVHLRMMWEPVSVNGQTRFEANWYYNTTTVPWTRFGSFLPDFREGLYFDIGLVGGISTNLPQGIAYFYQFGVASKFPVSGWKVFLLYPSFQYQGTWRVMERANIVQGDHSYWKVMYRWGGEPYKGVTVEASSTNSSIAPGIAEFVYNDETAKEFAPLW